MVSIDLVVMLTVLAGTVAALSYFHRRGMRGGNYAAAGWTVFFGLALVVSMAAHCGDILLRLWVGTSYGGEPMTYDFRVYGLELLGAVMVWLGVRLLRAARGVGRGEPTARRIVGQVAVATLVVVVPLMPFQLPFSILFTSLSVLTGVVLFITTSARKSAYA